MTMTTVVRRAKWLVAWIDGAHRYLRDADIAFAGDRITFVGAAYEGRADEEIAGEGLCVLPGLVDIHSHPMSEPMNKGFADDGGNPRLGLSGLYDHMPVFRPDREGMLAAAEVAYAELLMSGVTTLVDLSVPYAGWLELIARSGLRGVLAPMYRSARWYSENGHSVSYEWSEDGGRGAFDQALQVVDRALNHRDGRLGAMMTPSQVDTCTPELLRDSQAAARERGIPLQIHAAQSLVEFTEMTRRHGKTPIQWLDGLGLLGPETIVAHAIFLDSHSWVRWGTREDLTVLAGSGSHVAHCPNVFVKHGMLLESFGRYRDAGVNLGIGTDTFPHNMLEEMRLAALLGRVAADRLEIVGTGAVFAAATAGGAKALGRDDIGRLAVGAKADLLLVDAGHPAMRPLRDPLRSLVHTAAERAVRDVYIDGVKVVADGKVLTLDYPGAVTRLEAAALRAAAEVPALDWGNRAIDEVAPLALPMGESGDN
jgi:cytosine/adenosine deaminase-related metal-dependent hydrolase